VGEPTEPLELDGARVVVAGLGVSGRAAAEVLAARGARVVPVDDRADEAVSSQEYLAGDGLDRADLVVASPGLPPHHALLAAAAARGLPVWSEVELAWRVRVPGPSGDPAPWLALTGTNGKTTTVGMLEAILTAAGHRSLAVGNVGTPIVHAASDPTLDVLAVELSSFQLHFTHSMSARAAAVLNVAPDHLDWHGTLEAYAADKARIFERAQVACVYNAADPRTEQMVRDADVMDGALAVGFTLGTPGVGQVGLVEDVLVDRGFARLRHTHAAELGTLDDLRALAGPDGAVPRHVVADALAAAALALAHGVEASAVRDGLRAYVPGGHRIETVATEPGPIAYVDDSKATNAHAAAASLAAFEPGSVVWIAGGLAKGARFDELVQARRDRLRAVVLIGVDREPLRDALARHASDVPVVEIEPGDTEDVMTSAVAAARSLARAAAPAPATVLLAPACASMDQFVSYAARGDAFAAAARAAVRIGLDAGGELPGGRA